MSTDRMKQNDELRPEVATEIWLDYLEGELESSFEADLDLVVLNHPEYLTTLKSLRALKETLREKSRQEARALPADSVFADLKSNIMSEIETITPEKKSSSWLTRQKLVTAATAAMCVVVLGSLFTQRENKKQIVKVSPEEILISKNISQDPGLYSEIIITNQNSDDFVYDALAEKLSHMSERNALKMIEKLK